MSHKDTQALRNLLMTFVRNTVCTKFTFLFHDFAFCVLARTEYGDKTSCTSQRIHVLGRGSSE
jgi:hypothetical protein